MSRLRLATKVSTACLSGSGTCNAFSVARKCPAVTCQSLSLIPSPAWAVCMS